MDSAPACAAAAARSAIGRSRSSISPSRVSASGGTRSAARRTVSRASRSTSRAAAPERIQASTYSSVCFRVGLAIGGSRLEWVEPVR